MEHQIIKKISSLNDFDNDNDVEDIVEHNNTANKTHIKNITSSLTHSKGSNLSNLGVSAVTPVSQSHQTSNNNKWTHNNTNHINSVNMSSNQCSPPDNTSNNVSNSSSNSTKKAKNIVANNLSAIKDEHLLRYALQTALPYYVALNCLYLLIGWRRTLRDWKQTFRRPDSANST